MAPRTPARSFDSVVMTGMHPIFAQALAPFVPKVPFHQAYEFRAKTGPYGNAVDVYFDVDNDGDVQDMEVMFHSINVFTLLSEDQTEALEIEAFAHYEKECKEDNDDLAIERYESSRS